MIADSQSTKAMSTAYEVWMRCMQNSCCPGAGPAVAYLLDLGCLSRHNAPTLNRAEVRRGSGMAVLLAQA